MQIEFLISKSESFPTLTKCNLIHPQSLGVELDCSLYIFNC